MHWFFELPGMADHCDWECGRVWQIKAFPLLAYEKTVLVADRERKLSKCCRINLAYSQRPFDVISCRDK